MLHPQRQETITLPIRDLLYVFFKRKIQILLVFFGIVGSVVAASLLTHPVYESQASLLVKLGMENLYVPTLPSNREQAPLVSLDVEAQINSEIAILQSRTLLQNLVSSLGPASIYPDLAHTPKSSLALRLRGDRTAQDPHTEALLRLTEALSVRRAPASTVIEIRYSHESPKIAAQVLNALVELYLERHLEVHERHQAQDFFRQEARSLRAQVQQAQEQLEAFKSRHALFDPEAHGAILIDHLAEVRSALDMTSSELAQVDSRLKELRIQLSTTPKTTILHKDIEHTPELVRNLKARIVELELREGDLVKQYRDDGRVVRSVRDEIRLARAKLAEHGETQTILTRSGVNESYKYIEKALHETEADLKALQARQSVQTTQLKSYQAQIAFLNSVEAEYDLLAQNLRRHKRSYQLYMDKHEEALISDAMASQNITNVHVIEPAYPPMAPKSPRVALNAAIAFVVGVFASLGLAIFREYLDDTLGTEEDVQRFLSLPVLASIPALARPLEFSARNAPID